MAETEIKLSRIGRKPVNIPAGVEVKFDNGVLTVKGPKGTLTLDVNPAMIVEVNAGSIEIKVPEDKSPKAVKRNRAIHGLTRSLVANMVTGVTQGYQ